MGRPYAKLFRDIWADRDFCTLGAEARYVYLFAISQPDLNAAGVLALTVRRWAARLGITVAAVEAALELLHTRGYVVMDTETEELLVRTFIRNDGLWRIPNTLYAVARDAARTVSPTLRATLAAELASLPVDELTGKRAAEMKAQVSTVVATLSPTLDPTVEPRPGMRVRDEGAGAGGTSGSTGAVVDQSSDRYARDDLTDLIQQEVRKATGRDITTELAATICGDLLRGREVSDPPAYLRSAIRNERDPRTRFLPVASSHPSARPLAEAERQAGVNGPQPARGDTVHRAATQARQAISQRANHQAAGSGADPPAPPLPAHHQGKEPP